MKINCMLLALASGLAMTAAAATRYVDLNSPAPTPPYTSWATASTNIEVALEISSSGDEIVVTNGVYATGGQKWFDSGTNRIHIPLGVWVHSVNGPAVTIIQGSLASGTNAVRCAMLEDSSTLMGFTLVNGRSGVGNYPAGGGAYCRDTSVVADCIFIGNVANDVGGGAYRGLMRDCVFAGNTASYGGGAAYAMLINCIVTNNTVIKGGAGAYLGSASGTLFAGNAATNTGGGVHGSTVYQSRLIGNRSVNGGGAYGGTIYDSVIVSNVCSSSGGGAYSTTLYDSVIASNTCSALGGGGFDGTWRNCTVVGNVANTLGGGIYGGSGATLYNSIVYYNSALGGSPNHTGAKFNNCCTVPVVSDPNGISNAPVFVDIAGGNYRLQSNSPCINAGRNLYVLTSVDLVGNPRIAGSTVDIGAYEFPNPASIISYAWLLNYGLPTDGSVDFLDLDSDGQNTFQEWRTDTVPTDAASVFKVLPLEINDGNVTVRWTSSNKRSYWVERVHSIGGLPQFITIVTNRSGSAGTTTFIDRLDGDGVPSVYRVGVQP